MYEAVESCHRTDIGIKAELLSHGKKSLLRANLGCRVIVKLRVAYTGEEHSVCLLAHLKGLLRERVAHLIDGVCSAESLLVRHLMSELLCHGVHNGNALLHYLRADTVAGQYCNLEFHIIYSSIKFNIFIVAFMAASVWSTSRA